MRNLEQIALDTHDSYNLSPNRSIDRIPIGAPSVERAIETARSFVDFFQDTMDDCTYRAQIEAAWRAARGPQRWILAGRNDDELMLALEEFVFESKCAASGTRHADPRKVFFVFSGMGPQWSGMGRNLAENLPRFAEHIAAIDKIFIKQTGESIWQELLRYDGVEVLPTALAQMGNFLIQAALYHLLIDEAIQPAAVLGHSAGEVAAAYAAGVYTLEDAVKIAIVRGKLQSAMSGRGSMLAVGMGHGQALELIEDIPEISIAAVNDDNAVTLAGNTKEIEKLSEHLTQMKVFSKILRVEVPYHSPVMDEISGSIISQLSFLKPALSDVPLYSSVLGGHCKGDEWDAGYWGRNIRQTVLFADSVKSALEDGYNCFVEISPHPVLSQSLDSLCAGYSGVSVHHLLSRRAAEYDVFLSKICELAIDGVGRPPRRNSAPLIRPVFTSQQLWDEDSDAMHQRQGVLAKEGVRLLGRRIPGTAANYDIEISITDFPWLDDHSVQGLGSIIPATLWAEFMSLAVTAGENRLVQFVNLTIIQSLPVTASLTILRIKVESGVVKCLSRAVGKSSDWTLHALATIATNSENRNSLSLKPELSGERSKPEGTKIQSDQLYDAFRVKGLEYGGQFKNLSDVIIGEKQEAWASVRLDETFIDGLRAPWVLDAGLQLLIAAARDWGEAMYLPHRIGRIFMISPVSKPGNYKLHASINLATESELIGTVCIYDSTGNLSVEFEEIVCIRNMSDSVELSNYIDRNSYTLRDLSPEDLSEFMDLYVEEQGSEESETSDAKDENTCTEVDQVFAQIDEYWVSSKNTEPETLPKLFERPQITINEIEAGKKVNLIWLLPNQELKSDVWETVQLIQKVVKLDRKYVTLTLIANPGQHWVFGLRRSAANSYGFEIRAIMRDDTTSVPMLEAAVGLLSEHEMVFEKDEPLFKRLEKVTGQDLRLLNGGSTDDPEGYTFSIDFYRGHLQSMVAVKEPLERPGIGEICVRINHIGVTWKDIGKILGTIGTAVVNTYGGHYPGTAVAGVVLEAGPDAPFSAGERVFGALKRSFRKHATVTVEEMQGFKKIPDHITDETVVSHALPWLTALAVFDRSLPQPGEKVFIQSGAGAVGSVIRHYLKQLGAKVVTSVGTEEKLTQLIEDDPEIEVVLARANAIPDALIEAGHRRFDWIISTLAGPACSALLSLIDNRGQFINLGKPSAIDESFAMHAFDGNKSFQFIDVDQLMARTPGWLSRMLDEYIKKIELPENILPVTKYHVSELPRLLGDLAQGVTTGCLAIEMAGDFGVPCVNASYNRVRRDGQYLVTGGYGAVGLICAQWLVSRGARNVVLSGSSGETNDAAKRTIEMLRTGGVNIEIIKSDTTDHESVRELIRQLRNSNERIRGVIHAAGQISDGPFDDIDQERIERSFGPKLEGANYLISALDEAELMPDLDFIIMTSSISSVVGLTIQGTYASANSGLDGLTEQLRHRGIQACAIQLGPVAQSGMAAEEAVQRYFTTIGLKAIPPRRLFGVLDHAISATVPHFVIDDVDWARNGRAEPANTTSSVLRHIVQAAMSRSGTSEFTNLERLRHEERTELLSNALAKIIANAIGVDTDYLSKESNFSSLGIDSLTIMEVQAAVNEMLQQELPLTSLYTQDGTIGQLAEHISEYLAESFDVSDDNHESAAQSDVGKVTL